jgi:hypothetical protein
MPPGGNERAGGGAANGAQSDHRNAAPPCFCARCHGLIDRANQKKSNVPLGVEQKQTPVDADRGPPFLAGPRRREGARDRHQIVA